jgi:hypothetical protein
VLGDAVAGHAAVAEQVRALRRDDVRRVRDDEIEALPLHRVEEAAVSSLDIADAVQRRVEPGVAKRALVDVRRDHVLGVGGEQDRLNPVAGAQVERALAGAADGEVCERDRRSVHAWDVIGMAFRERRMIRCDQQLVVRDDARGAVNDVSVLDEQARCPEALAKSPLEQRLEARAPDRDAEQEEPDEHGEPV